MPRSRRHARSNHLLTLLAAQIRADILRATTLAGSGHPTSSLSAVELLTVLFFGGRFRADLQHPQNPANDRFVLSKGHAAPLLYALYAAAGKVSLRALIRLRSFNSPLEGHPSIRFPYVDVPTGSLGQGLGAGIGMAIAARQTGSPSRTYVLMGDGELAEGSVWEAAQLAAHMHLGSLVAIVDVNRLGQSGPTMAGHHLRTSARRFSASGWTVLTVDGHDVPGLRRTFARLPSGQRPTVVLAKTIKGKGVSFLENREGWHGKPLSLSDYERAMRELSPLEHRYAILPSSPRRRKATVRRRPMAIADTTEPTMSLRETFGRSLVASMAKFPELVVLDGDVKNSTMTEGFARSFPDRFLECFIAEQVMVAVASGLAARGQLPVVATFAAFLTRAFDQLRMAQYGRGHIVIVGTHAGISVGPDGPSQMGLEDVAMFRTLRNTAILAPADAESTRQLLACALRAKGIVYLRLPRQPLPRIYSRAAPFHRGGSHVLRSSAHDRATVVAHGVTVQEALRAAATLAAEGIDIRVIDAYSIHPLDIPTLRRAAEETRHLLVVEDHRSAGGFGEAVRSALGVAGGAVTSLAVDVVPRSGTPEELLAFAHIDADAIVEAVTSLLQ